MTEFEQLCRFLNLDPGNSALRLDCIRAGLESDDIDAAKALLTPLLNTNDTSAIGLLGLAQIKTGDFAAAETTLAPLLEEHPSDPTLQFNLAWSQTRLGRHEDALQTLSDTAALTLPQAAMLRLRLLHRVGDYGIAGEAMTRYVARFADHIGLLGSASTLAMDMHEPDRAEALAAQSPDHPESKVTLASLALSRGQTSQALTGFETALTLSPDAPRAWIGKGLSHLIQGDIAAASESLDKGAELFGHHAASWIGAGWSYIVGGDFEVARVRFNRALALDPKSADSHASLAVVDMLEEKLGDARHHIQMANHLNPGNVMTQLAEAMVASVNVEAGGGKAALETALRMPIDKTGQTLSQAIVAMSVS